MNSTLLYSFRSAVHLPVPSTVLDMIAAMQLAPVAPIYIKKPKKLVARRPTDDSWRRDIIVELKATLRQKDDPDYETIGAIVNKVVASTLKDKTKTVVEIIGKRDQTFRMRIVNYVFDRGVSMPFYAKLLADMFAILCESIPEIHDDLQIYCSLDTFHKMFDQSKTISFPDLTAMSKTEFEDALCVWHKQKELRRGFGVFAAELHTRGLISETLLHEAVETVISDFEENIKKPKNEVVSESVDQVVTLLSEMSKLFGKDDRFISDKAKQILAIPKTDTPCLGMRSRFKLEDCVHKV